MKGLPLKSMAWVCRHETGDLDGALADLNAAIKIEPDYVFALADRGVLKYATCPPFPTSPEC